MSYAEAMERYGSDKPDLRFGMPITDVTGEMASLGLESFPGLIAAGRAGSGDRAAGRGRRLRHPPAQDQRGAVAGPHRPRRARRQAHPVHPEGHRRGVANLVKKGASEEVARRLIEKAGARQGRHGAGGRGRSRVRWRWPWASCAWRWARELKLVDERAFRFLWVTDFPLLEYDAGERRYCQPAPPLHRAPRRGHPAARHATPGRCAPRPTTSS